MKLRRRDLIQIKCLLIAKELWPGLEESGITGITEELSLPQCIPSIAMSLLADASLTCYNRGYSAISQALFYYKTPRPGHW